MPRPKLKNVPASIRQKLLDLARERNQDFGLVLTKYALERILFRIGNSQYRDVFVLKGSSAVRSLDAPAIPSDPGRRLSGKGRQFPGALRSDLPRNRGRGSRG